MDSMQVLVIGKISSAVVLAGAAYQDEAGYARMTGLPREKTRLLDDKGRTDTQVSGLEDQLLLRISLRAETKLVSSSACWILRTVALSLLRCWERVRGLHNPID